MASCRRRASFAASRLNRWYVRTLEAQPSSNEEEAPNPRTRSTNGPSSWCSRFGKRLPAVPEARQAALEKTTVFQPESVVSLRSLEPDLKDILALRSQDHDRAIEMLSQQDGMRAVADSTRHPVARFRHARRSRAVRAAEGRGRARGRTDGRAARSQSRLHGAATSGSGVRGLRVSARGRRTRAGPRRCAIRCALPVRTIVGRHPREEPAGSRRPATDLRACSSRGRRRTSGLGKPPSARTDSSARRRSTSSCGIGPSQSLAHVFTLLSLVLPREPLQIAFRSLHADDRQLRGTALEYLEGVFSRRQIRHAALAVPRATAPHGVRPSRVTPSWRSRFSGCDLPPTCAGLTAARAFRRLWRSLAEARRAVVSERTQRKPCATC